MGKESGAAAALRREVPPVPVAPARGGGVGLQGLPLGLAAPKNKLAAWHHAGKPVRQDDEAAPVHADWERSEKHAPRAPDRPFGFEQMLGRSLAVRDTRILLEKIARTAASTILLGGESGTGKDLAARIIHHNSARAAKPFVYITCSALQESLLESELFGHEKGAFTDATTLKKGQLEGANGGTVFLDEIGEMSLGLQSKLLRFLEDKSFKRVGGSVDIHLDVRIIAATNRNLEAEVKSGRFRADLYYRLRVLPVVLPPLRLRTGDIPLLVKHFLQLLAREFDKPVRLVAPTAQAMLEAHRWPGNIRELKHAMHRAVLLSDGGQLAAADFLIMAPSAPDPHHVVQLPAAGLDLDAMAGDLVLQAIERAGGNQTRAATLLAMSRDQMRYRLDKLGWPGMRGGQRAE